MTNPRSTVSTTLSLKLREKLDVNFHLPSLVMTTVICHQLNFWLGFQRLFDSQKSCRLGSTVGTDSDVIS